MKAVILYSLHDYLRSHKYFPPISTFFILVIIIYAYKPNPIIDSYAITSFILYVISAWLCVSMLSLDSPVQRQVMIVHTKSRNRFYVSKLMSVLLVSVILTVFAFIYPLIFNMFNETVTLTISFVALLNHILLAILGICVASLFSAVIMRSAVNSFGGLALTIVTSIAALGIQDALPELMKSIVWIIPPAASTQVPLMNWDGVSLSALSFFPFMWIFIYSLILAYLFITLARD